VAENVYLDGKNIFSRRKEMAQKGFTLWFTGLSGSGKSTIAERVALRLERRGLPVEVLDGDVVRTNLSKGLGFSREDRDENIKRVGFVCGLLTRHGVVAVASVISPYRDARDHNRKQIGKLPGRDLRQARYQGTLPEGRGGRDQGLHGSGRSL
jgi:adenylylsulfate kinase-like enzyme